MTYPKVSIIIPAYNCEQYIGSTIKSCLCQDYDNIEVIVVNDGSSDCTAELVASFLPDSRIIVINQENKGVSAARNHGLECATGDYITFLDSDDELAQDTISRNIEVLISNQDANWLYFPIQRIDKLGNRVDEIASNLLPSFKYKEIEKIVADDAFSRMARRRLPTCVCGALYKRDFIDLKFKEGRFEDTIMVMELLRKQKDIIISPYGAYIYYDRSESFINSEWDADKWISYVNVLWSTMQTKMQLFPSKLKEIEHEKTRLYYTLRYLKAKNCQDEQFSRPLEHFKTISGNIKPSVVSWSMFILKSIIIKCRKFVTRR